MNFQKLSRRDLLNVSVAAAVGTVAYGVTGTGTALAQAATGTQRLPISMVNTGGPITLCFQELIKRKGYYDEFGLDVTTVDVSDSTKIIGSLISGDSDICILSGLSQIFPAIAKGAHLKILASCGILAPISLFSGKPNIKTLKDLEGKTIGTGAIGAALQQITLALLLKNNVDVSNIRFLNVGTTSDILKAVAAGVVDAGTVNVDAYDHAAAYKIHPLADFFIDLKEYPYQGSFSSDNAIKTKREQIIRLLAAFGKLYQFIQSPGSESEYAAAYAAAAGGSVTAGQSQWRYIQKYKPYGLIIPESSITYLQQLNLKTGVQKAVLPINQVADLSLAKEALKRIS